MSAPGLQQLEGKYEIVQRLGSGGMGAVYKVRHRLLDEIRVVKTMHAATADDQELRHRFLQEARIAVRLRHPNIAELYDFTVADDGTAFIVMEYIPGIGLDHLLGKTGPLDVGVTLELAAQSLAAIGYLHDHSYVHRDVAPDNLMLSRDSDGAPRIKLIDLGIAKTLGEGVNLTATGAFLGKIRYSSPEHFGATGGSQVDPKSDLYSFGVVLYELLTGRLPFEGASPSAVIGNHLFRPPIPFEQSDPSGRVPGTLRAAILRALAKDPAERFPSAAAFASELRSLQPGHPAGPEELARVMEFVAPRLEGANGDEQTAASLQASLDRQFEVPPAPSAPAPSEESPPGGERPAASASRAVDETAGEPPGNEPAEELPPELEEVARAAGGSATVIFKPIAEAVIGKSNDRLISPWLRMQNSEQIESILSSKADTRLLITGFGSFGGSSLIRGVTAKLMRNHLRRDRRKVLVVRLESLPRAPAGAYNLYVNEKPAGTVLDQMEEAQISPLIELVLGEGEPALDAARLGHTFRGLEGVFVQGGDQGADSISGAAAGLVFQLMMILQGSHDDAALEKALDQLLAGGSRQVILVVDRIDEADAASRVLDSALSDSLRYPNLSVLAIARRELFDRWPPELRRELARCFRERYVRRLWDQDLDLTRELGQIVELRDSGDPEQRRHLDAWLAHLAYVAQGSIALALRHLKSGRDWKRQGDEIGIDPSEPYRRDREQIEHNAYVQTILVESWTDIDGGLFNSAVLADQARIGVYQVVDWMRGHPIFRREQLIEISQDLPIPISNDREVREETLRRLLEVLERAGYLRRMDSRFALSWRQKNNPPAPTDPFGPIASPPPPTPGARETAAREARIALLVDSDRQRDEHLTLATQIAFEIAEEGLRLTITDRPGVEAAVRRRLSRVYPLYAANATTPAKPVSVLVSDTGAEALAGEEVVAVVPGKPSIDDLLAWADAVIYLGWQDDRGLDRLAGAIADTQVSVVPVGAAGGLARTVWQDVRMQLSGVYGDRVEPELFERIGPASAASIPELARDVVTIAKRTAGSPGMTEMS